MCWALRKLSEALLRWVVPDQALRGWRADQIGRDSLLRTDTEAPDRGAGPGRVRW